jgi:hypothetical protein
MYLSTGTVSQQYQRTASAISSAEFAGSKWVALASLPKYNAGYRRLTKARLPNGSVRSARRTRATVGTTTVTHKRPPSCEHYSTETPRDGNIRCRNERET